MDQTCDQQTLFEVTGYEVKTDREGKREMKQFKYVAKNVVLATGQTDDPNRLEVPGEDLPFVLHKLKDLDDLVKAGHLTPNSDPVLVVGAGLSAADAIINAQGHGLPIAHVFRKSVSDPSLIFNKLPVALYPEYHAVHRMMASGSEHHTKIFKGQPIEREYPGYVAWGQTDIVEITKDRKVRLKGPNTNEMIQVSYILVLIGASPDLSFLAEAGHQLGRVPGAVIGRNNPIDIDVFSHQSTNIPGLFAMGPLTGDNFVRFIQGGALAITSHVHHREQSRDHRL
jgi:thioredoxin reductase